MAKKVEYIRGVMVDGGAGTSNYKDIDYKDLLYRFFLKRWYLYVISAAVFVTAIHFYLKTLQPEYEISCKILIRQDQDNNGATEDLLKRSLEFSTVSENVFNEIQILTSFQLMKKVVEDLQMDISYYWKSFLTVRDGYRDFPIAVDTFALSSPASYAKPIEIVPRDYESFDMVRDSVIGTYQFDSTFVNELGLFRIGINNTLPIHSEASMFIHFHDPAAVAENYLGKLSAGFTDKNSTTVDLSFQDAIPQRGIDILNSLIQKYNLLKITENNAIALNTLEFIEERIGDVGTELRSVESSLESFKLTNEIVSETTSDLELLIQNVNKLSDEREDIELQLNIFDALELELSSRGNGFEPIPINPTIMTSPQIQDLVQNYNTLAQERKKLLLTAEASNPAVQANAQRLNSLRNSIFSAFNNVRNDLALRLESITSQYDRFLERLRSVPTQERELLDKSRQQGIIENLYVYLLQKKEETALALVGTSSNSRLIDPPHSSIYPVYPNKKLWYLASLMGGLALPFFFIALQEFLTDTIRTEKELKRQIPNYLVLGIIGKNKTKKPQLVLRQGRDLVADRFRFLRNNLKHFFPEKQKCIMVTSSTKGEGKTFVATNLAASFASAKIKTVIVDFDMYNPQMTNFLEEDVKWGLKNYLSEEVDINQVIHSAETVPGLDFISSGINEDNPADLIANHNRLEELFSELREKYEVIIVDTPPVGMITDAFLLSNFVTVTLYVIRSETTKKSMVEGARELFDKKKLVNPALVLNWAKKVDVPDYYK